MGYGGAWEGKLLSQKSFFANSAVTKDFSSQIFDFGLLKVKGSDRSAQTSTFCGKVDFSPDQWLYNFYRFTYAPMRQVKRSREIELQYLSVVAF